MIYTLLAQAGTDPFGTIEAPQGVAELNAEAGGIGILLFFSRFIQFLYVIGGLYVLYNFISAGFTYLSSSGDPKATETVRNKITMSVLGLLIIVLSFAFASLIGLIFFGNANFILNPTLVGPSADAGLGN